MTKASELVTAARDNCVGSYCKIAQHCDGGEAHGFGTAIAFATGVPVALFNGCLAFGATAADSAMAIDWITRRAQPYLLWVDDASAGSGVAELALGRGLHQEPWALPAMVLSRIPKPPTPPPGIRIEQVQRASLTPWLAIVADNGMPLELAERLFSPSFAADPDVALFSGHLDDVPVGTSIAIRTGNVCGVYAVLTVPSARRRGVGTAAVWAAVDAGREWGCHLVTLQASEMAFSGYTKMGFETVEQYITFAAP